MCDRTNKLEYGNDILRIAAITILNFNETFVSKWLALRTWDHSFSRGKVVRT